MAHAPERNPAQSVGPSRPESAAGSRPDHDARAGQPAPASPGDDGLTRIDGCELCRAARITPWYHEDEICWIAECDICEVPMVVWRYHGTEPPDEHLRHMQARLREVAAERVGEFWIDGHMRNIPDHFHAHARPRGGFFGR
jgi:hypothetical protein